MQIAFHPWQSRGFTGTHGCSFSPESQMRLKRGIKYLIGFRPLAAMVRAWMCTCVSLSLAEFFPGVAAAAWALWVCPSQSAASWPSSTWQPLGKKKVFYRVFLAFCGAGSSQRRPQDHSEGGRALHHRPPCVTSKGLSHSSSLPPAQSW